MIIEEFLQESGFEKREKYFDWLMRGGRGGREGTPPSCLVVLLWYFIGSEVVCFSGINWVGSGVCRWKKKRVLWTIGGVQTEAGDFGNFSTYVRSA